MSKYDDKGLEEILLSDELDLKDPELYDRLSLFFQALAKKMHQAEDIKKSSPWLISGGILLSKLFDKSNSCKLFK